MIDLGPRKPPADPDDFDLELDDVPADGDDDGGASVQAIDDDIDVDDAEGDPFDDREAADLDIGGTQLDELDDDGSGLDAAEGGIDIGSPHDGLVELDDDGLSDDRFEEDDDDDDGLPDSPDDGGSEGTGEEPADALEALPELDADDGGDFEEPALLTDVLGEIGAPRRPPTIDVPWQVREGAGAEVPCTNVSTAGGLVAAAGRVLLVAEPGSDVARREALVAHAAHAAVVDATTIVTADARGVALCRLREGEPRSTAPGRSRDVVPLASAQPQAREVRALCTDGRRIFLLRDSELTSTTIPAPSVFPPQPQGAASAMRPPRGEARHPAPPHDAWATVRPRGVVAIAAVSGAIVVLSVDAGEPSLEVLRGDDDARAIELEGKAREIASTPDARVALSPDGRSVAVFGGGEVAVARPGEAAHVLDVDGVRCVAFEAAPAAPLCILCRQFRPEGATTFLARASAREPVVTVLTLPSSQDEHMAMAWDDARDLLWLAGPSGLSAVGRAAEH